MERGRSRVSVCPWRGRPACACERTRSRKRDRGAALCAEDSVCLSACLSVLLAVHAGFSPAEGACAWLAMFLVALGAAFCHFAVCLLVTTSARADGASGGRETDGDAWAARAPCPSLSSCRHTHTHSALHCR